MDTSLRVKRRHKVWPEALKREIVAACLVPGASVSMVARQYDVNTNQVFTWRRLYAEASDATVPQLLPVVVTPEEQPAALPPASPDPPARFNRSKPTNGGNPVRVNGTLMPKNCLDAIRGTHLGWPVMRPRRIPPAAAIFWDFGIWVRVLAL